MAKKRNPVKEATNQALEKLNRISTDLAKEVKNNLDKGMDGKKAIATAVKKLNLQERMKDIYSQSIVDMFAKITGDKPQGLAFRDWYLNKAFDEDGLSLSDRVNKITKMDDIKKSINASLKQGESWRELAKGLTDKNLTTADIPKYMDDLVENGRRAMNGNPTAIKEYQQTVIRAKENIAKLAQNGAPTQRLKAAYADVIRATEKVSEEGINKAIERMVEAKARYNGERVARTEMAKAYAQQNYATVLDDDQVVAIGYDLNDGHPKPDICDFHTGADLYGLGAGVYPLNNLPKYPFHPNCICTMYSVYEGESRGLNRKAGAKFLEKLPADKRKAILGASGEQAFMKAPDKWDKQLPGYEGHQSVKELFTAKKLKP